ncbi:hypothetical protein PCE1_004274 [Barthelona sp. PCE]
MQDNQSEKQITRMIQFIKSEAREKILELQNETKQACQVAKLNIIQENTARLEQKYSKEKKQIEVDMRIEQSGLTSDAKLEFLASQEDMIKDVFGGAEERIGELVTDDAEIYSKFLLDSIVEATIALKEPIVKVICRPQDEDIVTGLFEKAAEKYLELTQKEVQYQLSNEKLPAEHSLGGVGITDMTGRIFCDNTLEKRLETRKKHLLPHLKNILFSQE